MKHCLLFSDILLFLISIVILVFGGILVFMRGINLTPLL